MVRKLVLALVLACLMMSSVQAGLQSALTTPLVGIRIPGIRVSDSYPPIPEGALFIDPVLSTRGEGVFREGPDFTYDATTGGVTVFAPPMLGPADEFGVRMSYSPVSIQVVGNDFFADAPTIPQLTKYVRETAEYSRYNSHPLPFDDDDPSFVIDELGGNFSLHISSEAIQVYVSTVRIFSGAEVDFANLLAPGLEAETFDADEGDILPNSIWPYSPQIEDSLPEVHFLVEYNVLRPFLGYYRSNLPDSYSLLAVPQAGLFGDQTSVPEPSSILLAAFSLIVLLTSRRVPTGK